MANYDKQIQDLLQDFTAQVADIIGSAIDDAVRDALGRARGAAGAARAPADGRRKAGGKKASKTAAVTGPRRGKKTKGGWYRRSEAEIKEIERRLLAEVKGKPGRRIEEIGQSMKESTKTLALPVRHLIETKKIKTKGQKRATRYFPS